MVMKCLNDDELSIICEFLNLTNAKTNLNLSLVNRAFYSITTSDVYWKKIIEKYNVMDESIRIEEIAQVDIKKSFVHFRKMQCFNNDPFPSTPKRLSLSTCIISVVLFLLTLCLVVPGVISFTSQLKCERKIVNFDRLTLNDTVLNRFKNRYTLELAIKDNFIRYSSVSVYECFEGECEREKYENFTTFCTYDPRKKAPRLNTQADFIGLFSAALVCFLLSFGFFFISLISFLFGLQFIFELLYRNNCLNDRIEEGYVYFMPRNKSFFSCLDFYLKFTGFSNKKLRRDYKRENV